MTESSTAFNVPRGTAYIAYQQIVVYAATFVYYVLLIRILNLPQIGEVSLLGAAMAIFTTLTQLSLPVAATKFMSAHIGSQDYLQAGAVVKTTQRLIITIAAPVLVVAILASPAIGSTVLKTPDSALSLSVTFAASFLIDVTTLYGAYFLGLGMYADMVYQNVLYVPLSRGLGLVLAYKGLGVVGIPLGWAIGALITLLLSLYLWKGRVQARNEYPVRPLLAFSLPLFASTFVVLLQGWGDITLLQGLLGQFGTTGAYYIVVSSVSFLSILWAPVTLALYPSLSSNYQNNGPGAVSAKLGVAARLVNLTVLPAGAALAAIASTALTTVYGSSLGDQALPFAILSITIIFTAQSLLLTTTLQATGKTKPILWISLTATFIDLAIVALGAKPLGTTAGAMGRAILPLVVVILAWQQLRRELRVPITNGLAKAVILALVTASLLAIADYAVTGNLHLSPLTRIPILIGVFAVSYLITSRTFRVFTHEDFDLLRNALPAFLNPALTILERIVVANGTKLSTRIG